MTLKDQATQAVESTTLLTGKLDYGIVKHDPELESLRYGYGYTMANNASSFDSLTGSITSYLTDGVKNIVESSKNAVKSLSLNALKSLVPTQIPLWAMRNTLEHINWGSELSWEVSLEGLDGVFKTFCPMYSLSFDMNRVATSSLVVGGYSFDFPSGSAGRTCVANFNDDAYSTLAVSISKWMEEIRGFNIGGVAPLATCGRQLTYRGLTRAKVEVIRVNMLVIPDGKLQIDNTQSAQARTIPLDFRILGMEILRTQIPEVLDKVDVFNVASYVPMGSIGDIFGMNLVS